MDQTQKYLFDAYMKPLYDGQPEGRLKESVDEFGERLAAAFDDHPGSMNILEDSGLQDDYNKLYMAVINRNSDYSTSDDTGKVFDYGKERRLPTVHEFLGTYRTVYESAVKPNNRPLTDAAYEKLFDVENRTDDLIEAQLIIERENLIVNTVTADYKAVAEDFLEACDPNYEVTSAGVKNTIGVYATGQSVEEITYSGEVARAVCDDIAVQTTVKAELMTAFVNLIFWYERGKASIRKGDVQFEKYAQSLVLIRARMKRFYSFLSEEMGITWDIIEKTPFYRISLLNPQGLDELWRLKKVMHPGNIEAVRYILFEEILSDRSMEDILMAPQAVPYRMVLNTREYPDADEEFRQIAESMNSGIRYFQRNRTPGETKSLDDLIKERRDLGAAIGKSAGGPPTAASGGGGKMSAVKNAVSGMDRDTKKSMAGSMAREVAKDAAKETAKGLLRGLFRR